MPPPSLLPTKSVQSQRGQNTGFAPVLGKAVVFHSNSVARSQVQLSLDEPLGVITFRSDPAPMPGILAIDHADSASVAPSFQNQLTNPANPAVQPPAFTSSWNGAEDTELDALTRMLPQVPKRGGSPSFGDPPNGDVSANSFGYHLDNNDFYSLKLNTVTFSGTKFKQVTRDLAQTPYAPPHWEDTLNHNNRDDRTENWPTGSNGAVLPGKDMGEPVSFGRNSQMQATINVSVVYIPPNPNDPLYDNNPIDRTVFLRGITYFDVSQPSLITGVVNIGDPKTDFTYEGTLAFLPNLMNTVYHWSDMEILWQYAYINVQPAENSAYWRTFNKSHNANYVTLDTSKANPLYLTLADCGTLAAHGETTASGAVAKMWNYISRLNVYRSEDSYPLTYYSNWNVSGTTLSALLKDTDAQCSAWADQWIDLLRSHGIETAELTQVNPTVQNERFLVKNWNFANLAPLSRIIGNEEYLYVNSWMGSDFHNDEEYTFDPLYNVKDLNGTASQFNSNAISNFGKHFIVKYGAVYYDPSYGLTYTNATDMQDKAISGFYYEELDFKRWWIREKRSITQISFSQVT